ncbi:MAG: DUF3168 domain-containing protein [Pseudonocardiaceae bacterium]
MTCQPELQQAIYSRLAPDAALAALITGVFDEVPIGAATPYVVIGDVTEDLSEAHDRYGIDATVTVHIWSTYRGYYEAAQILKEVDRLLHRSGLSVSGFTNVSIAQEQHQFMRDPDPDYRHVMARYRIWLEKE